MTRALITSSATAFSKRWNTYKITPLVAIGTLVVARARADAPTAGARVWIEVTFEPIGNDTWSEAYDQVLSLLDIA